MSYLTLEEYLEYGLNTDITIDEFDKYERYASLILDAETRNFYRFNDFESDRPWRKDQFKRAIIAQIDYYIEAGAMTSEGFNSEAQSVQVGRTMLSQVSNFRAGATNEKKSIVSHESLMHLAGTGLLNRGVGYA